MLEDSSRHFDLKKTNPIIGRRKMRKLLRYDLSLDEMPKSYYNILADIPKVPGQLSPPLHPGTRKPLGPADLEMLFPKELIRQEVSGERYIPIPEEIREAYSRYRPSPLFRAKRLEEVLKTSARIFFKYEGNSPPGSHKPNTA